MVNNYNTIMQRQFMNHPLGELLWNKKKTTVKKPLFENKTAFDRLKC